MDCVAAKIAFVTTRFVAYSAAMGCRRLSVVFRYDLSREKFPDLTGHVSPPDRTNILLVTPNVCSAVSTSSRISGSSSTTRTVPTIIC